MKRCQLKRAVASVLLLCAAVWVSAQNAILVKGSVKDEAGEAIIGASVAQKGNTSKGVISDINGDFTISVPEGTVLVVSYIGYITQEVEAEATVNVVLAENSIMLQEAVVVGVGYGTMRKSDLTGSIASVSADELKQGLVTSTEQLLQGKIAGLSVTQASSDPTTGSSLRLRGGTSLSASNSPLIVVDGIPGVDINTVQPSEIVSMDVLKDASAAAIYGSRGANGVIIVTTNRATDTEVSRIGYNGWVSIGTVAKNIDSFLPTNGGRMCAITKYWMPWIMVRIPTGSRSWSKRLFHTHTVFTSAIPVRTTVIGHPLPISLLKA